MAENLTVFFQAGSFASYDVLSFRVERALGLVATAAIDVHFAEPVSPDELLGTVATLTFGRGAPEHVLHGVLMAVELTATAESDAGRGHVHRVEMTSLMGLLAQEVDCRIFQDKDVKEIVAEVLTGLGIDDARQSWRLVGTYPKREYCVQYNESALAFVSRLLEEEGIYYSSDKNDEGEVVVFEDDSTTSDPVEGDSVVPYRYGAGLLTSTDAVGVITQRHRTATGKIVLRDYDFKKPQIDLTQEAAADEGDDLEIYDYPGLYSEPDEGARLATVRLEGLQAERKTFEVESGCPRVLPGKWLEMTDTPNELDGEYLVTGAVHELTGGVYLVRATMIPKSVKYRSPRRTPAPVIDGPQTAVVVAPPGSPTEEIHVDEHGRCKVKFHWDKYGLNDDTATFWMRVSQAQTSGSMIFPRVGWEVVVEFLEGNPDRPIITGRVYNGRYMPPYALPEGKSRTSLQTASSPGGNGKNEIRLEDKAGSEEVSISAQKDTTLATANNKTVSTAVDETKNVKVDATLSVGADQTIKVTNGYLNTVDGSQTIDVGGTRTAEVNAVYGLTSGGASATSVGGGQMEMDGNPIEALLALAVKAVTDAAQAAAAKQLQALDQAVSAKVDQVMGPINQLQSQVESVGAGLQAVSDGNLGAAAGALGAAAGLPTPAAFGAALAGPGAPAGAPAGDGAAAGAPPGDGAAAAPAGGGASAALGLDSLVSGAIASGSGALGSALGLDAAGGGGASAANAAGPAGTGAANSGGDSATGPGHAINVCSATHTEDVGSIKATIAAAGIHTTVKGARTLKVGAAHVELVGGTRAEACLANKTEKAIGLVVLSSGPESETVGGSRTTMVGGAILEKIGASGTVTATAKAMFVGAFHKIDATTAIVLKCGGSEVVIDGSGVTIKSTLVTITAPKITLTKAVNEG